MQVVINISDKDYQNLKAKDKFDDMYLNYYERLIVNGIPLPQNHGDLKDMDDIYEALRVGMTIQVGLSMLLIVKQKQL